MTTVALIGADGAGKTTIARRLEQEGTLPIKYLYMGVSTASSNQALPTTRLWLALKRTLGKETDSGGPPDPKLIYKKAPRSPIKRLLKTIKDFLRLGNLMAEEWFRQGLVWYYLWRGHIVLFDRHFFIDYFAYDIAGTAGRRTLSRRIHGAMLAHIYPRPDLIILLDAPAALLFERKGEGTVELLERRRQEYWQLKEQVRHFTVVDAGQPLEQVLADVSRLIAGFDRTGVVSQVGAADAS